MPALGVSAEDLVNRALTLLGEDTIESLSDTDDKSLTCNQVYVATRDEVLSLYPWRCLMKKAQLSQVVAAPTSEWTYAYTLPSDRLGQLETVFTSNDVGALPFRDFDIVGDQLLTDATEIWADYPALIAPTDFPAHIRALMQFALAARLAEPITEDQSKAEKWEEKAFGPPGAQGMGGFFARARLIDSQQRPSQEIDGDYSLATVRF